MWDVQQPVKPNPPSLSQWLYQAIDQPGVRLRIRLRGNNLHILLEGSQAPTVDPMRSRVIHALQTQSEGFQQFFRNTEDPVYKVILYGRRIGQQRPDWIESIVLADLDLKPLSQTNPGPLDLSTALLSNEHLARTGSPEAIARYLSESLSHLGVSVKVLVQKLPDSERTAESGEKTSLKRLWVICSCHYSPDSSLIAEPIAQQLRDLELKGFKEAIIRSQVQGEASPDWVLQVDLTHPTELLWEWAKWGDGAAIARLLNQRLAPHHLDARAIADDQTLHIFCRPLPDAPDAPLVPPAQVTIREVSQCLTELMPQGMTAAAIYGIKEHPFPATPPSPTELATLQTKPAWVNWLPLANPSEQPLTVQVLARQKQGPALTFLLQRCLNPDIDGFLATGGIRVKLCFRGSLLHIMTEAVVCPRQTLVVPKLEAFLEQLQIPEVTGIRIYGRRAGQSSPLWSYGKNQDAPATAPSSASVDAALRAVEVISPHLLPTTPVTVAPRWPGLRAMLQRALCFTTIVVPHPDSAWQPSTPSLWHTQQGWRTAIAWSLVGLIGMVSVDWWLSHTLRPTATGEDSLELNLDTELTEAATPSGVSAAILASARAVNPPFNNRLLDEKLALYQEQVSEFGSPDILIVGSSRAMRGIDPDILRRALGQTLETEEELRIFNFGVNGATAQVVELLVRRILLPEQLPKLILWADGARAFNSGRGDRTYEAIEESEGYQELEAGTFPVQVTEPSPETVTVDEVLEFTQLHEGVHRHYQRLNDTVSQGVNRLSFSHDQRSELHDWLRSHLGTNTLPLMLDLSPDAEALELMPQEAITTEGFLPLERQFDPELYYTSHPKVSGDYDTDYAGFALNGWQLRATQRLLRYLKSQQVAVVLVNLPLTDEYLDDTRLTHERDFIRKMKAIAADTDAYFNFRDLGRSWPTDYAAFSDPSHLNRYGAAQISRDLAQDATIPWPQLLD